MNIDRKFALGVDFGTASVRTAVIRVTDGIEVSSATHIYRHGTEGCMFDPADPQVARQHPDDYTEGLAETIRKSLSDASRIEGFSLNGVIGLGFDTTGTSVLPVLRDGTPLALTKGFKSNLNAHIWLWKDHSAWAEAEEITRKARESHPEYIGMVGGTYSSEWYWSKVYHCLNVDKEVFSAAVTWMEVADWLLFTITGGTDTTKAIRGICAAGHKALYNADWGGYPAQDFIESVHPDLLKVRATLDATLVQSVAVPAGMLSKEWADKVGLPQPIIVATPAFDAHFGGIGAGIKPGMLVKTIGTSTCDLMVSPASSKVPKIPGMAGIVRDSILPNYHGIEAGQSAVGDIFNWFVKCIRPGEMSHQQLSEAARTLAPGESGLLALDWHNGNRTILVDQRLSGLIVGLTLQTSPAEIYRALIEATAFGARVIHEQMEKYGLPINEIVVCGGIPRKDTLFMQIYADVFGKPLSISRNAETCALGGAIAASVVAGAYPSFDEAIKRMTAVSDKIYRPIPENRKTYNELYGLYRKTHDAFSVHGAGSVLSGLMKQLLSIKDNVRSRGR